MSDITNILVCGIGGQGVMTATEILAVLVSGSAGDALPVPRRLRLRARQLERLAESLDVVHD